MPNHLHTSLRWSLSDPLICDDMNIKWKIIDRSKKSRDAKSLTANHMIAQGSSPMNKDIIS